MHKFCQINRIVEELPANRLQFIAKVEAANQVSITIWNAKGHRCDRPKSGAGCWKSGDFS